MRYFADSFYWIALLDSRDQHHAVASAFMRSHAHAIVYTAEDCIVEVFDFFCNSNPYHRMRVVHWATEELASLAIVVPRTSLDLQQAIQFYARRPDKGYSLTDCLSMQVMRDLDIKFVLTRDQHFAQEGFTLALDSPAG